MALVDQRFTNQHLLQFIEQRIKDQDRKETELAKQNTIKKYSEYHSLVFPLQKVVRAQEWFIIFPDQAGLRYNGWICLESILFLYGAFEAWVRMKDPYRSGVDMVYTKPYNATAVYIFVEGNRMTMKRNKTTNYELNLMSQSIDAYLSYYFNVKYQSKPKQLKSSALSDDEDDDYLLISHQKKKPKKRKKKKFNKDLMPKSSPHPLPLIPYNNNNTNNRESPPSAQIIPQLPSLQNITSVPEILPPVIVPFHFGLKPNKPAIPTHTQITTPKYSTKRKSKKTIEKKKQNKNKLSSKRVSILSAVMGDVALSSSEKDILRKMLKIDLNEPIKNNRIAAAFIGSLICKLDRFDIAMKASNIQKIRDVLFPLLKLKKCHINGNHTYSKNIGGFDKKEGAFGEYVINCKDSYIWRIFNVLLSESNDFGKKGKGVIDKLFPEIVDDSDEEDVDEDNDNVSDEEDGANSTTDEYINKTCTQINEQENDTELNCDNFENGNCFGNDTLFHDNTLFEKRNNFSDDAMFENGFGDETYSDYPLIDVNSFHTRLNVPYAFDNHLSESQSNNSVLHQERLKIDEDKHPSVEIEVNGSNRRLSFCSAVQQFSIDLEDTQHNKKRQLDNSDMSDMPKSKKQRLK